ncbi:MAG: hypothetical protein LBV47_09635 [Bacteroidales bacterium]|jgi:hypothetical protein|nr:hypothetical protein [Bacteroidales bacterium]
MVIKNNISILTMFFIGFSFNVVAQRDTLITQEVEVVKTYNPTIASADKINDMPVINEGEQQKPTFNYSIYSQPVYSNLSVNAIKAATLDLQQSTNNGFGLVRAGLGNYSRPYGELFLNSRNTNNTIFVLHGKHISSSGKLKLKGGDKVKAPFSENEANMFIKHLYRQSVLSVNLNLEHNSFNYYGYPLYSIPSVLKAENQKINYFGKKQAFTRGGINISLKNEDTNTNFGDPLFDFDFIYRYFGTKTGQREHFGEFTTDITKPLDKGVLLLNLGATYVLTDKIYNSDLHGIGRRQQTWLTVKPAYYVGNETANIKVGFNVWYVADKDKKNQIRIAPDIRANFAPVKEIINIYVGVDGKYINNHYSKIAYENPFVNPEHDVINTFEKLHFYGGFDGKLSAKTNFKISADYSKITDKPLFYLLNHNYYYTEAGLSHKVSIFDNDFEVLYDDMDVLKLNAEIYHAASRKVDLLISGNYFIYKMKTQKSAWNLPDLEGKISLGYKITEQLSVAADVFLIGTRKALVIEALDNTEQYVSLLNYKSYNLNTVLDMNISADYKITKKISAFVQLNNLGFRKYEQWFGYTVQSFNFLGGISCSF